MCIRDRFESRLRFDKVTESLKVGRFLRHSVVSGINLEPFVRMSETSKPYRREQNRTLRPISEKLSPNLILW